MAVGAINRSRAHYAVSVTSYAGQAGPGDEPGVVHFALGNRHGCLAHQEHHFGEIGRGGVRIAALRVSLQMLDAELVSV